MTPHGLPPPLPDPTHGSGSWRNDINYVVAVHHERTPDRTSPSQLNSQAAIIDIVYRQTRHPIADKDWRHPPTRLALLPRPDELKQTRGIHPR